MQVAFHRYPARLYKCLETFVRFVVRAVSARCEPTGQRSQRTIKLTGYIMCTLAYKAVNHIPSVALRVIQMTVNDAIVKVTAFSVCNSVLVQRPAAF